MVRLKHRYLVVLVTDTDQGKPAKINEKDVYTSIFRSVQYLHGGFGDAAVHNGFSVKYINKNTGLLVVRTRRGPHQLVASALPLVSKTSERNGDAKISISTLYTGACIKQCLLFIKKYQLDAYHKAALSLNDNDRHMLEEYMKCDFV